MTLQRRTLNLLLAGTLALAGAAASTPRPRRARTALVLGMVLEPTPGLDPTTAPAAAIGEIVHYNILEGLTKINVDGTVTPLLAESWSDRARRQELHLQADARASSSRTASPSTQRR